MPADPGDLGDSTTQLDLHHTDLGAPVGCASMLVNVRFDDLVVVGQHVGVLQQIPGRDGRIVERCRREDCDHNSTSFDTARRRTRHFTTQSSRASTAMQVTRSLASNQSHGGTRATIHDDALCDLGGREMPQRRTDAENVPCSPLSSECGSCSFIVLGGHYGFL